MFVCLKVVCDVEIRDGLKLSILLSVFVLFANGWRSMWVEICKVVDFCS